MLTSRRGAGKKVTAFHTSKARRINHQNQRARSVCGVPRDDCCDGEAIIHLLSKSSPSAPAGECAVEHCAAGERQCHDEREYHGFPVDLHLPPPFSDLPSIVLLA